MMAKHQLDLNNEVMMVCIVMCVVYSWSLQLSKCQDDVTSLEHKLTTTQQVLDELTETKRQEVASLQDKV